MKEAIGVVRAQGAQVAGVAIIVMRGQCFDFGARTPCWISDRFVRSVRMSTVHRRQR